MSKKDLKIKFTKSLTMFKNLSVKLAVLALLPASAGKYTTIYKKTWLLVTSPRSQHTLTHAKLISWALTSTVYTHISHSRSTHTCSHPKPKP